MKLDAHCAVADGFDAELVKAGGTLGPDVTQVPAQYNHHILNWRCVACGHERYQGPTPTECSACHQPGPHERKMIWQRRKSRLTTAWRFDSNLHFAYWGAYKDRPEVQAEYTKTGITDTMSLLGACWCVSRERYWQLDGLDEAHGGWGQMGTELACKSWLSG